MSTPCIHRPRLGQKSSALLAAVWLHSLLGLCPVSGGSRERGLGPTTAAAATSRSGPTSERSSRLDRDSAGPTGHLARTLSSLEGEFDLAEARRPYLVVDLDPPRLRLLLHGVLLREVPMMSASVGARRQIIGTSPRSEEVFDRIWSGGRLVPARERVRPIQVSGDSTSAQLTKPPLIPPLPEEATPAPKRYLLRLDGGLTVEFCSADSGGATAGPQSGLRLHDLWPPSRNADRWRLRIVLPTDVHAEFYRSLPDSCALLMRSNS